MSEDQLPEGVRDLILRHVHSVVQLEVLLFLRERPREQWDVASVAKRLYAPVGEMAIALAELCKDGFLVREGEAYRYAPISDHQARVDALARAYVRQLIPITNLIHSKPRNIRAFSDAFKFRKD